MASTQPNVKTTDEPPSGPLVLTDQLRIVQGDGSDDHPYTSARTSMQDIVDVVLANAPVGGVQTVTSSDPTKLTVDATDPAHLVITSLGGGSGLGYAMLHLDEPVLKAGETWTRLDGLQSTVLNPAWHLVDPTGGIQQIQPTANGLLLSTHPTAAADNRTAIHRTLVRPVGGGATASAGDAYVYRGLFGSWNGVNYIASRLVFRNSTTGYEVSGTTYWNHQAANHNDWVIEFGTNTGRAGNTSDVYTPIERDCWIRLVYLGSDHYALDYSPDGRLWGRMTQITSAFGAFDTIGIGVSNYGSSVEGYIGAIQFGYMTGVA